MGFASRRGILIILGPFDVIDISVGHSLVFVPEDMAENDWIWLNMIEYDWIWLMVYQNGLVLGCSTCLASSLQPCSTALPQLEELILYVMPAIRLALQAVEILLLSAALRFRRTFHHGLSPSWNLIPSYPIIFHHFPRSFSTPSMSRMHGLGWFLSVSQWCPEYHWNVIRISKWFPYELSTVPHVSIQILQELVEDEMDQRLHRLDGETVLNDL